MLNFDKLDRRVDALEKAVNERQQTEDLDDIKRVSKLSEPLYLHPEER